MSDIMSQFKALKLHGMAECYAEIQTQGQPGVTESTGLLNQLLVAEATDRSIRAIRYQMGSAKFPIHRDLSGFDFALFGDNYPVRYGDNYLDRLTDM
jgi:hypothetical protein